MLTPRGATLSAQFAFGRAHTGANGCKLQVSTSLWDYDSVPYGDLGGWRADQGSTDVRGKRNCSSSSTGIVEINFPWAMLPRLGCGKKH